MPREPIVIVHEFGPEGHRKYMEGTKPGRWKRTDKALLKKAWNKLNPTSPQFPAETKSGDNNKDDETNGKEKTGTKTR